jgi:hypothetical protein
MTYTRLLVISGYGMDLSGKEYLIQVVRDFRDFRVFKAIKATKDAKVYKV